MRILIVGMTESIHLAKWVSLMDTIRHDVYLFPSTGLREHPRIDQTKVKLARSFRYRSLWSQLFQNRIARKAFRVLRRLRKAAVDDARIRDLATAIKKISPDLVHSMETQHAGYLVLDAKRKHFPGGGFPRWLHTNWGSDVYLFGRLAEHEARVRGVLSECDYYSCEGERDNELARRYGYRGPLFEPFPNAGGFDLEELGRYRTGEPPSARSLIMVKGYQGWAGRSLVALRALALAGDGVRRFKVVVYSVGKKEEVLISAELLRRENGLDIEVLDSHVSHERMLEYFARARLYVGLSISDGISTSMLEAMAMGVFPVQSDTSMASEWIEDGKTGFIVPAEDPEVVAERIARALEDDALVDAAAAANVRTIEARADSTKIGRRINGIYDSIADRPGAASDAPPEAK